MIRTDSRSTKMLIEHVCPKQVVILGGDESGIDVLRQHLIANQVTIPDKIHAPKDGQAVDVTSDLAMFRAVLSEEVIQGLYCLGVFGPARLEGIHTPLMADCKSSCFCVSPRV